MMIMIPNGIIKSSIGKDDDVDSDGGRLEQKSPCMLGFMRPIIPWLNIFISCTSNFDSYKTILKIAVHERCMNPSSVLHFPSRLTWKSYLIIDESYSEIVSHFSLWGDFLENLFILDTNNFYIDLKILYEFTLSNRQTEPNDFILKII